MAGNGGGRGVFAPNARAIHVSGTKAYLPGFCTTTQGPSLRIGLRSATRGACKSVASAIPLVRGRRATHTRPGVEEDRRYLVKAIGLQPVCLSRTALLPGACLSSMSVAPPPLCAAFRAPANESRHVSLRLPPGDTCPVSRSAVHRSWRLDPSMGRGAEAPPPAAAPSVAPGCGPTWLLEDGPCLVFPLTAGVRDSTPWR